MVLICICAARERPAQLSAPYILYTRSSLLSFLPLRISLGLCSFKDIVCAFMYLCAHTYVHLHAYTCRLEVSALSPSLSLLVLRQGLLLKPELNAFAMLTGQWPHCLSSLPSAGIVARGIMPGLDVGAGI